MSKDKIVGEIDGLRALAITAVVLSHFGYSVDGGGGVTLFFVISGYLITMKLHAEARENGTINLKNFYIRRFARLYPSIILVALVTALFLLIIRIKVNSWALGFITMLTFTTNLLQHFIGVHQISTYFQYSWSLGVEEQFYLAWPPILLLCLKWKKKLHCIPELLSCSIIFLAMFIDIFTHLHGSSILFDAHSAFSPLYHFSALMIGALLARIPFGTPKAHKGFKKIAANALLISIAFLLFIGLGISFVATPNLILFDLNGLSVLSGAALLSLQYFPNTLVGFFFHSKIMQFLGRISYSVYLINMLCVNYFIRIFGDLPEKFSYFLQALLLTVIVLFATIIHQSFERPLREKIAKLQR